jgi:hypothetical protein
MPRARKLFPVYGSTLANNMLTAITRDGVVNDFVAAYVAAQDRREILGGPARDRELVETVGREILLAMILEVQEALPGFFGKKPKSKLKSEEKAALDAFSNEMLAALERAQKWNEEDRRQFRRDLALYADFKARQEKKPNTRKKEKGQEEEPPFVARVALLLDPSLLDEARRAARKFHGNVGQLARKLLRRTLG